MSITVGGNDAGFGPVIGACVVVDCVGSGNIALARAFVVAVLPLRLAATYRAVHEAAPGARLVVVGYPRLFPADADDVTGCPWLSEAERRGLNRAANLLNRVTRAVARHSGARFVDVGSALAGHELCTADSWLYPIGDLTAVRSWAHPVAEGQQAIADRVTSALRES